MNHALKEWAVAVDALAQGKTIVLLRKGGIREHQGKFTVEQHRVWLYPTYEHQKPHLLKSPYAEQVQPVESGWHPETVPIQAWADITHITQISELDAVQALHSFHVWNEQFASERFNWKPRQPLYVLLLRVYKLPEVQHIFYRSEYGGCKSWIELEDELGAIAPFATPVLTDKEYDHQVNQILS